MGQLTVTNSWQKSINPKKRNRLFSLQRKYWNLPPSVVAACTAALSVTPIPQASRLLLQCARSTTSIGKMGGFARQPIARTDQRSMRYPCLMPLHHSLGWQSKNTGTAAHWCRRKCGSKKPNSGGRGKLVGLSSWWRGLSDGGHRHCAWIRFSMSVEKGLNNYMPVKKCRCNFLPVQDTDWTECASWMPCMQKLAILDAQRYGKRKGVHRTDRTKPGHHL